MGETKEQRSPTAKARGIKNVMTINGVKTYIRYPLAIEIAQELYPELDIDKEEITWKELGVLLDAKYHKFMILLKKKQRYY